MKKNTWSWLGQPGSSPVKLPNKWGLWEDGAMIVMSPARADDRITLRSDSLGEVIKTIGTNGYGRACLGLFEQSLDADHWALFHYRANNSVSCIATASRMYIAAAQENINRFV
jgi:hypothetical protein